MTEPISMERAHQITAEVTGELSLAIERKKASKAMMLHWVARMRMAADAFEAKITAARATQEPDPKCMLCEGTGAWETAPEELGWRRTGPYAWTTEAGLRVPAHFDTIWVACPCTERTAP